MNYLSYTCLQCLCLSFDNSLLGPLCLGQGRFCWLELDLGLCLCLCLCLCLVGGNFLGLVQVQPLFLDLYLQPGTLFPLLLLPLIPALHLRHLVFLRLLLKKKVAEKTGQERRRCRCLSLPHTKEHADCKTTRTRYLQLLQQIPAQSRLK